MEIFPRIHTWVNEIEKVINLLSFTNTNIVYSLDLEKLLEGNEAQNLLDLYEEESFSLYKITSTSINSQDNIIGFDTSFAFVWSTPYNDWVNVQNKTNYLDSKINETINDLLNKSFDGNPNIDIDDWDSSYTTKNIYGSFLSENEDYQRVGFVIYFTLRISSMKPFTINKI